MPHMPTDAQVLHALEVNDYIRIGAQTDLGVGLDWLRRAVVRLRLEGHEIPNDPQTLAVGGYIPTPDELIAAREAIKARWTPQERAKRYCYKPRPVEIARVGYDRRREYKHYSDTEFSGVNISAG